MDTLMTLWVFFIGSFIGIIIGVILSFRTAVTPLQQRIDTLSSQQEHLKENLKYYPYNPARFRFIGEPVDGIQFEKDAILFVRFKEGSTPRTHEQDDVKSLLEAGKVKWFEFMTK